MGLGAGFPSPEGLQWIQVTASGCKRRTGEKAQFLVARVGREPSRDSNQDEGHSVVLGGWGACGVGGGEAGRWGIDD